MDFPKPLFIAILAAVKQDNNKMTLKTFNPDFDILPQPQKDLWGELKEVPDDFVLYGGTAIALQLGHRESVNFDFFVFQNFDPDDLLKSIPALKNAQITQRGENTLSVKVNRGGEVYLSFFGLPHIKPMFPPLKTNDGIIKVASLLDLSGMKASVVQKRAEWKDYVDLAALIDVGITLPMALSAGQAIYKDQFNPQITLKALSYFDDIQGITPQVKRNLQDAVRNVDLKKLPSLESLKLTMLELNL